MRAVAIATALLAASGCASAPQTVTVEVPVPVYCEPPERPRPALPVDALPAEPDAFEIARALWASIETLEAYAARLEADVHACRANMP